MSCIHEILVTSSDKSQAMQPGDYLLVTYSPLISPPASVPGRVDAERDIWPPFRKSCSAMMLCNTTIVPQRSQTKVFAFSRFAARFRLGDSLLVMGGSMDKVVSESSPESKSRSPFSMVE